MYDLIWHWVWFGFCTAIVLIGVVAFFTSKPESTDGQWERYFK